MILLITFFHATAGGVFYRRAGTALLTALQNGISSYKYELESLMPLLLEGKLLDAAKLVMTVYGTTFSQNMDDSDGIARKRPGVWV